VEETLADGQLPPEIGAGFVEIAARAFAEERLIAEIETGLAEGLTTEDVLSARAFYASSLGQKARVAETQAAMPAAQLEIEAQEHELRMELEQNEELAAFITLVDERMHASDLAIGLMVAISDGMLVGMSRGMNPNISSEQIAAIRQQMEVILAPLEAEVQDEVLLNLVYTYRHFSADELTDYAAVLETAGSHQIYGTFFATLDQIFRQRGDEIGFEFAEFVRQKAI
jgi:hypothetical protein